MNIIIHGYLDFQHFNFYLDHIVITDTSMEVCDGCWRSQGSLIGWDYVEH
jgi:hypothetical protein